MTTEDRRGELIDVALRVFAEHGVEGTSMKRLAQEADVSCALFYHYFRSKEELLTLALQRESLAPQVGALLEAARERPAAEVLPELARSIDAAMQERRSLVWLFLNESRTRPAVAECMDQQNTRLISVVAGYLQARVEAGELRPHDTQSAAIVMLSAIFMQYVKPAPVAQDVVPCVADLMLRGLLAR